MTPYYEQDGITIYHGDCLRTIEYVEPFDSVITDPVWPNNSIPEFKDVNAQVSLELALARCLRADREQCISVVILIRAC